MKILRGWGPGDPYCGTANEALDYALDVLNISYSEAFTFLHDWRDGDLRDWPDFKFAVQEGE